MSARPDKMLERLGQFFELSMGFLLLPLIVTTMDRPPMWFGGRTLLWASLGFLFMLQPREVRSRLIQRMRPARTIPGGWIGPIVAYVLLLSCLGVALQMTSLWNPPPAVLAGGLPAALLVAVLGMLFTVLPMEILFRVYFPTRFSTIANRPSIAIAVLSTILFAWFHIPTLEPVLIWFAFVLGGVLALMERAGWPFWSTLGIHGLSVWIWLVAPRVFTEAIPWLG